MLRTLVLALALAGCVGDSSTKTDPTIDCNGEACDPADSYCLISTQQDATVAQWCVPRPDGCDSCDCDFLTDAVAFAEGEGADNCTGAITSFDCANTDGEVVATVTCAK